MTDRDYRIEIDTAEDAGDLHGLAIEILDRLEAERALTTALLTGVESACLEDEDISSDSLRLLDNDPNAYAMFKTVRRALRDADEEKANLEGQYESALGDLYAAEAKLEAVRDIVTCNNMSEVLKIPCGTAEPSVAAQLIAEPPRSSDTDPKNKITVTSNGDYATTAKRSYTSPELKSCAIDPRSMRQDMTLRDVLGGAPMAEGMSDALLDSPCWVESHRIAIEDNDIVRSVGLVTYTAIEDNDD
ncbi:hypothetical protein KAU11_06570 [Candidatus Babeliales bacterium]|nr:hypothetical protein [Candidatus Babeliales bacterium]